MEKKGEMGTMYFKTAVNDLVWTLSYLICTSSFASYLQLIIARFRMYLCLQLLSITLFVGQFLYPWVVGDAYLCHFFYPYIYPLAARPFTIT